MITSRTRTEETETSEIESQERKEKRFLKKNSTVEKTNKENRSKMDRSVERSINLMENRASEGEKRVRDGELGFQLLPVNEMEIRVSASAVPAFCSLVFVASAREREMLNCFVAEVFVRSLPDNTIAKDTASIDVRSYPLVPVTRGK